MFMPLVESAGDSHMPVRAHLGSSVREVYPSLRADDLSQPTYPPQEKARTIENEDERVDVDSMLTVCVYVYTLSI